MALRLKKDVQKASYYVWFLGAQEARGLRGSRVLLPAIPRLVERSNEQEPLKVTLQVSHKGLKIIQVSGGRIIASWNVRLWEVSDWGHFSMQFRALISRVFCMVIMPIHYCVKWSTSSGGGGEKKRF